MRVIVKNLAIEYEDAGSGKVMLMVHGWMDSRRTFDEIAAKLQGDWRIIRLDLPGFGGSELPSPEWGLTDYVDLVAGFISKLDIEATIMLGHSLGGRIILKGVADGRLHPEKVVLIASAGVSKSHSLRNRTFKVVAKTGKLIASIPPLSLARDGMRKRLYKAAGSDYLGAGQLAPVFLKIIAEDLQSSAARVKVPTLLIWGDKDTETPLPDAHRLAALIHGSNLFVVEGATHFVHQEQSVAVAQAIEEFAR